MYAQNSTSFSLEKVASSSSMRWVCPEIDKTSTFLYSLADKDEKTYARNVMWRIDLEANPSSPNEKYIVARATIKTENPQFDDSNLLKHIANWIKKNKKWTNNKTDMGKKALTVSPSYEVARHNNFFNDYKATVSPLIIIQLLEDKTLFVSLAASHYTIKESSSGNVIRNAKYRISEMFPYVDDSKYKNTCALAFVNTHKSFWAFIADLRLELNNHFAQDEELIKHLRVQEATKAIQQRYQHSSDSLKAKYGEPTKIITGLSPIPDIHSEMRFYEEAQKLVFMGTTINFRDIVDCEIVDDPQFVPGRTTTYGGGLCFFGFQVGAKETRTTAGKTIHNYVVDVKIDNLRTPFIRIATGNDEFKAKEISFVFDYILRHKNDSKSSAIHRKRRR